MDACTDSLQAAEDNASPEQPSPIVCMWGDLAPLCLCLGRGKWDNVEPLQGRRDPFYLSLAEEATGSELVP